MKIGYYTDYKGYRRRVLMRDEDTDPRRGLPQDPPDVQSLDWNKIKSELHSQLIDRGLFDAQDLDKVGQKKLDGAILLVLRRRLLDLYRK